MDLCFVTNLYTTSPVTSVPSYGAYNFVSTLIIFADFTMPTPRKVLTPGSYKEPDKATSAAKMTPKKGKTTPKKTARKTGRPSSAKKKEKKPARKIKHRAAYTEEDMKEAVRLVQEEGDQLQGSLQGDERDQEK
jgi:hypothetical protein